MRLGVPTVSVVLPVRDGERFLAQALEALSRQTFESFEALVIDDGSTDRSAAIALEHARADARVVLHRQPRRGIAAALNAGIAVARGRYIARMDADDISHPSRLQRQVDFLDSHDECVGVGTHLEVIDEEGQAMGLTRFPARHPEIVRVMMGGTCAFAHATVMMRKDALLAAGGYRGEYFPSEDLDLWLRLVDVGQLANVDEPLVRYRRHAGTVGARECDRQMVNMASLLNPARARQGLPPLAAGLAYGHTNHDATYHFECVRIALTAGNRRAARRHALACLRRAPGWWRPYVALASSFLLPDRALASAARAYRTLRLRRTALVAR